MACDAKLGLSFVDKQTGKQVAIKKIKDACSNEEDLKRDLLLSPDGPNFRDIYIVTDLMDTDLYRIIRSHQSLSNEHVRYFIYQLLRGLKYIHSANVMHRDLKPNNLLVRANCDLKICDLGLARLWESDDSHLTCYVVTRWYRAPELMLGSEQYTNAIDMWSVGCILAELLTRTPLFPGKDYVEMLKMIVATLGNPTDSELSHVSSKALRYLADRTVFPASPGIDWRAKFPHADDKALDMLQGLLKFDPAARLTVEEALGHPYMHELHDSDDEPSARSVFDFDFEKQKLSVAQLRDLVVQEQRRIAGPRRRGRCSGRGTTGALAAAGGGSQETAGANAADAAGNGAGGAWS